MHVRFDDVLGSSIRSFGQLLPQLRSSARFSVKYESHGRQQSGVDGGGLFRDWLGRVTPLLLDPSSATSVVVRCGFIDGIETVSLSPNLCKLDPTAVEHIRFAGALVAISLRRALPLGVRLSIGVCKLMLGQPPSLEDLAQYAPEQHAFVRDLLLQSSSGQHGARSAVSDLSLSFTAPHPTAIIRSQSSRALPGADVTSIESLCPGGETLDVDETNWTAYAELQSAFWYRNHVAEVHRFMSGFRDVDPRSEELLADLSPETLQSRLLGEVEIDVDAWKHHTRIVPEDRSDDPVVGYFWEYVKSLSAPQCSNLLFWLTGYRRLPGGAFPFTHRLHVISHLSDQHMPVTHTCGFVVEVPSYSSMEVLKERFEYALQQEAGFHIL